MKPIPDSILDLIHSAFNASLDETGEKQLHEWLNADPEHRQAFEAYLRMHHRLQAPRIKAQINQDKAWALVKKQLRHTPKRPLIKRPVFQYAAAAIVLVLLASGFYRLLLQEKTSPGQGSSYEQLVATRGNKARLELSSGQVLELSQMHLQTIKETDGTQIRIDTAGFLHYRQGRTPVYGANVPVRNTLSIPRTGKYRVILADSTVVWLNSATTLDYPVAFSGNTRKVSLQGEAYFNIAPDKAKPFIVETPGMQIKATGTAFNVKAYEDDPQIAATLVEGGIKVVTGERETTVKPGYQATFARNAHKLTVREVNTSYYTSWIQGVFRFNNTRLQAIAKSLHRWYNIPVRFTDTIAPEMRFTGVIEKHEPIEKLFTIMEATNKVTITLQEDQILIAKK